MKILLSIVLVATVNFSLLSFETTESNTTKTNLVLLHAEFDNGGRVCRTVTTSCGSGSGSTNRACVTYSGNQGPSGAAFLANTIASEMGTAACNRMGEIGSATAEIGQQ